MKLHTALKNSCIALLLLLLCSYIIQPLAAGAVAAQPVTANNHYDPTMVEVKFDDSAQVTIQNNQFVSQTSSDLTTVNSLLAQNMAGTKQALMTEGSAVVRQQQKQLRTADPSVADLGSYYRIKLPKGKDSKAVAASLKNLPGVAEAYAVATPAPAPAVTPNFASLQTYLTKAPSNMGITPAATLPGALGGYVRVADVEYSWSTTHEDLAKNRKAGALWAVGTPVDPFANNDHGTAVSGILAAGRNSLGINGIVSNSDFHMVNTYSNEYGWDVASAVYTASTHLTAGDVMLIEQQTWGPDGTSLVPVEWTPSVYDAIKSATAAGIIVVEAAGNSGVNLSDPAYGTKFPAGKADSGAIIVGAGSACGLNPTHYRLGFSNYGARVNFQGEGECVMTTGYGQYYGSDATNNSYANNFNGTSSASALVAATAAATSSAYEAKYKKPATPAIVKAALKKTGTVQDTTLNPGNIGPLPNLVGAIKSL